MEILNLNNASELEDFQVYLFAENYDLNILENLKGDNIYGVISHKSDNLYGYKCYPLEKVFKNQKNSIVLICQFNPVNKKILDQFNKLEIRYFYFERIYNQYLNAYKNYFFEKTLPKVEKRKCDLCGGSHFELINDIGFDSEVVLTFMCKICCHMFNIYENYETNGIEEIDEEKEIKKSYSDYTKIKYLLENNKDRDFDFDNENFKLLILNLKSDHLLKLIDDENKNIYAYGIGNINKKDNLRIDTTSIFDLESYKSFDVILNFEGLESVDSPKIFLEKIHEHLELDDFFILRVKTLDKVKNFKDVFKKGNKNVFTFNTIRSYLESTGFKVLNFDMDKEYTFIAKKIKDKSRAIYEKKENILEILEEE